MIHRYIYSQDSLGLYSKACDFYVGGKRAERFGTLCQRNISDRLRTQCLNYSYLINQMSEEGTQHCIWWMRYAFVECL